VSDVGVFSRPTRLECEQFLTGAQFETVKVGVLGLGTVGGGTVNVLKRMRRKLPAGQAGKSLSRELR